jgi:asparagine synthase (glutamine-hydrolysing)
MCGIAGYYAFADAGTSPTIATLEAMRDIMAARGPDGAGLWLSADKRVGLAHRRLSIIDTSAAGAQPMHLEAEGISITYNGEIYNYRELKAELEAAGRTFQSGSDTEVLLNLYAVHGDAMCHHLRGMFAFAIWDAPKQTLLLARDPYGIKPLYYCADGGVLRFASQVRALLVDPAVSRDPSPAGLVGFHIFGAVPEPHTVFRSIRACPPGSTMTIRKGLVGAPQKFACLPGALSIQGNSDPAQAAAFLRESINYHLVADVEVGAFLSGGVDSGAIIGLMRDCGQNRITACTLGFEEYAGTSADEISRAARIARHYDVQHHIRTVTETEYANDLPLIFAAMDQPSIDGINSWFISKACRELGLKVALSGLGGDELLGGYSTFQTVPATLRAAGPLARNPVFGPALRQLLKLATPILFRRNPKLAGLFDLPRTFAGAYLLRRAVLLPFEMDNVMDPAMAREGLAELEPEAMVADTMRPEPASDNGKTAALESGLYMRNQLLRDTDWAGMAHSLEVRVPWVDYHLLRQMAPITRDLKQGEGKAILANAPSNPLPAEIVNHPKTGFQIPTAVWSKRGGRIAERTDARAALAPILKTYRQSLGG